MSQRKPTDATPTMTPIQDSLVDVAPANPTGQPAAGRLPGPLGLPRTYWVLWTGMLVNRLGGMVFLLLGIYLTRNRGLRPETAGLIISLNAAGSLLGGPVGGALADRIGRRASLLVGTLASGSLMLLLGAAQSTGAIAVIAPLLGFFAGLCPAPLQAAVADLVPAADRARAYGVLYWAINLGFAGAAAIGGLLADGHFTSLFVIDGLTTYAYGALVLLGVPETRPSVSPAAKEQRTALPLLPLLAPFRDRPFVAFVLVQTLLLLAFAQVMVALPLDMRAHGLTTSQIGWLLGLNGVYIVIGQPIALRTLRRLGHDHWMVAGAALVGLGLGALAFAETPPAYALSTLVWTLGEIGFSTAVPALVADMAPANRRGAYQGTHQLAWGVSTTFAPALGTEILARLGSGALWGGCLGVGLVAAGLHARLARRRRRFSITAAGAGTSPSCR